MAPGVCGVLIVDQKKEKTTFNYSHFVTVSIKHVICQYISLESLLYGNYYRSKNFVNQKNIFCIKCMRVWKSAIPKTREHIKNKKARSR